MMDNEKLEILRLLIENREEKFSIRKLSILRKINYKSAYFAVEKLQKEKIISFEKYGNVNLCQFNGKFNDSVYLVESQRREDLLKNKNFKIIKESIEGVKFPLVVLLFGSFAKGTMKKNSDIDIISISANNSEVHSRLSALPLNIHFVDFSYEEFISGLDRKSFGVIGEAVKNNIILVGIEEYYRMINNAYI